MPKMKYENIYKDLKEKIETGVYPGQTFIPSENQLVNVYGCSRNTVRRAIRELSAEGYLQSQKGRGVFVIYQPISRANYLIGGIETFKDSAKRNHLEAKTKVIVFEEIKAVLAGEAYTPPTLDERIECALLQLRLAIEEKGEDLAVRESRKQIASYLHSFRGAASLRARINSALTYADVEAAFDMCKEESAEND